MRKTIWIGRYLIAVVILSSSACLGSLERYPRGVFSSVCSAIHKNEALRSVTICVLAKTEPIYDFTALFMLSRGRYQLTPAEARSTLEMEKWMASKPFTPMAIKPARVRNDMGCKWMMVNDMAWGTVRGRFVLELSGLVNNPYPSEKTSNAGIFARFSYQGQAASWYWIPVKEEAGRLVALRAQRLGVIED